jgi:hypothetical protein
MTLDVTGRHNVPLNVTLIQRNPLIVRWHAACMYVGMETPSKRKRVKWGDPGSKVVRRTSAVVFSAGARRVIVAVYPDGVIGLRLSKLRREEFINADDAYRNAVMLRKANERAAKRKKK